METNGMQQVITGDIAHCNVLKDYQECVVVEQKELEDIMNGYCNGCDMTGAFFNGGITGAMLALLLAYIAVTLKK